MDYFILISLIVFLIFLIYFIYFKINLIYYFFFPKIKSFHHYFNHQPHYGKDELNLNYSIEKVARTEYTYTICSFVYIKNWKYRYYQSKSILSFKNPSLPTSLSPLSIGPQENIITWLVSKTTKIFSDFVGGGSLPIPPHLGKP